MTEIELTDRRVFTRFAMTLPLTFLDSESKRESQARMRDFSAKGLGMITDMELQPNYPLEIWLRIPDRGEPLYAKGKVVWLKKLEPNAYRVGVNLEKADLMGISRLLRIKED